MEKKKNNKKAIKTELTINITINDITKEEFENSKEVEIYHHPKIGTVITKTATRKLCPDGYYIFRTSTGQNLTEKESVHLSQEEAAELNVPITGNPKLGVRLYNESACRMLAASMSEELQKNFLKMVFCLFHRKELEDHFNPKSVEETVVTHSNISTDSEIKDLLTQNTALLKQQNEHQKQTAEALCRIADLMERYFDKKTSAESADTETMKNFFIGCSKLKETTGSNDLMDFFLKCDQLLNPIPEKILTKAEKPAENTPEKEQDITYQEIQRLKESGTPIVLQLKRDKKDLIYKKNPNELDIYRKQVLEGIPQPMQNHVLSRAYTRMRDVYGVPLDTYKNEYFADTGKLAKSTLEIAHWLEFRNPVIQGLLKCCVQTVSES